MSGIDTEKLTAYLDSLLELGIPSVDCIVYRDHQQIYRHMNGTVDIAHTQIVREDQRYLMFLEMHHDKYNLLVHNHETQIYSQKFQSPFCLQFLFETLRMQ